jgi:hypothetical protein
MSVTAFEHRIGRGKGVATLTTRQRADVRTLAEVRDGINALTVADWGRLKLAAARYSFGGAIEPDDLLQEAMKRSLEKDGRKCPLRVDLVKFLIEGMRSISDGEREKAENRIDKVPIGTEVNQDDGSGDYVDPPDPSPTVEERLGEAQETAAMKASLLLLFIDDQTARDIIEGIWLGYSAEELRTLIGLNKTEYDSKRKLMHRRITHRYPNGWKL